MSRHGAGVTGRNFFQIFKLVFTYQLKFAEAERVLLALPTDVVALVNGFRGPRVLGEQFG